MRVLRSFSVGCRGNSTTVSSVSSFDPRDTTEPLVYPSDPKVWVRCQCLIKIKKSLHRIPLSRDVVVVHHWSGGSRVIATSGKSFDCHYSSLLFVLLFTKDESLLLPVHPLDLKDCYITPSSGKKTSSQSLSIDFSLNLFYLLEYCITLFYIQKCLILKCVSWFFQNLVYLFFLLVIYSVILLVLVS